MLCYPYSVSLHVVLARQAILTVWSAGTLSPLYPVAQEGGAVLMLQWQVWRKEADDETYESVEDTPLYETYKTVEDVLQAQSQYSLNSISVDPLLVSWTWQTQFHTISPYILQSSQPYKWLVTLQSFLIQSTIGNPLLWPGIKQISESWE